MEYDEQNQKWQLLDVEQASRLPDNVVFTEKNELKFFKLLSILLKNCEENLNQLKKIKGKLADYLNEVVISNIEKHQQDKEDAKAEYDSSQAQQGIKHHSEVKEKLKTMINLTSD